MKCRPAGLWLRWGALTCVGTQVALCDPIRQVTLRSFAMGLSGLSGPRSACRLIKTNSWLRPSALRDEQLSGQVSRMSVSDSLQSSTRGQHNQPCRVPGSKRLLGVTDAFSHPGRSNDAWWLHGWLTGPIFRSHGLGFYRTWRRT